MKAPRYCAAKIQQLATAYLDKARRNGGEGVAISAIEDYFKTISAQILRVETACQKNGNRNHPAYLPADLPVVDAARPAQLFDCKVLVARIEQKSLDVRRDPDGFLQGVWPRDVDHLHESDAGLVKFAFEPLRDDQVIQAGNVLVRVIHTPGHTPDGVSLLVTDKRRGEEPWFVLTGDTLFVGAVGRPDLAGAALPRVLAPTLLIVGGADGPVIQLNDEAKRRMSAKVRIEIVPGATHLFEEPGALDQVSRLALEWFSEYLAGA